MYKWVLLIFLIIPNLSYGETKRFGSFLSQKGIPYSDVNNILEDSYGFLWIATWNGLIKFNGYEYTKYHRVKNDKNSLPHNICYKVFEDSKKRLWICTAEGLIRYQREYDNFQRIYFSGNKRPGTFQIIEDNNGYLWLLNFDSLIKYDPQKNKAQRYSEITGLELTECGNNIWICSLDSGVYLLDKTTAKLKRLPIRDKNNRKILSEHIRTLKIASDSSVFLGSSDNGIFIYDKNGIFIKNIKKNNTNPNTIKSDYICSFFEDENKNIWIGSVNGNLAVYNLEKQDFIPFNYILPSNIDKQNITISCMLQDSYQNMWLSTHRYWLLYSNNLLNSFTYFQHKETDNTSLSANAISCFAQNKDQILIGTDGGGLNYLNNKKETFEKDARFGKIILDIKQNKDSIFWIATWGDGIIKYDKKRNKIIQYRANPTDPNSLPSNKITSLLVEDSCIWLTTDGKGVAKLDIKSGQTTSQNNCSEYPFTKKMPQFTTHIMKDHKNRLWICSSEGLSCFAENKYTQYSYSDQIGSLSQNETTMSFEDSKGRIWIITETGGLELFIENNNSFINYSDTKSIPQGLKSITEDKNGNLWIGGMDEIIQFNPDTDIIKHYDLRNDLKRNTLYKKALFFDSEDNLYIGTNNGAFRVNLKDIKINNQKPKVYLKDLYIWDQVQQPGKSTILKKDIAFTDTIILNHHQNFFSIEYFGINLDKPDNTVYSYILEGFHPQWINAKTEMKASFTNLDAGKYRFIVKACTQDGVCSTIANPLTIIILPPWWQTWWFKILIGSTIIFFFFILLKLREKTLQTQNKKLEILVDKRTTELQQMNEEILKQKENVEIKNKKLDETLNIKDKILSVIAHDLKNPLTAIVGMLTVLSQKNDYPDLEKKQINTITHAARKLQEQMENLLHWVRIQTKNIFYSPEEIFLDFLTKDSISLLQEIASEKEIQISLQTQTSCSAFADSRMINTVIRNLLYNAIKFTKQGGNINISISEKENSMEFSIKDNGIGMTEEQQKKLFDKNINPATYGTNNEKGSGLGLKICYDFILINNGKISISSKKGEGTTVIISLPKGKTHKKQEDNNFKEENIQPILNPAKEYSILLVDDNPDILNYLSMLFQSGFQIIKANNGIEGLEKAQEFIPDIIITDIIMPQMDGKDFCIAIKENPLTQHIPVLLLTSEDSIDSQLEGLNIGADDYITKPFHADILMAKVQTILKNKEKQKEHFRNYLLKTPQVEVPENKEDAFLKKIMDILKENISEPELSVEFIAEKTALSRVQLFRKFKAITGCSPSEYIKSFRLQYAATLLKEGKYSVAETAYEVGYSDPKYFSSCFSDKFGKTPSQYAKEN